MPAALLDSTIDRSVTGRPEEGGFVGARARGTLERLLDGVPRPAALLAADRRIVARNVAAQATPIAMSCIGSSYGRVTRFAGAATEPFDQAFVRALNGIVTNPVVTMALDGRAAMWRVTLGPLEREGTADEAAVIVLIDPPPAVAGTPGALRRLFGLTPAEARVLALLLDDCRPSEIAQQLAVSITTVRSHLKALFSKTGTRRQTELVALAWSAA